LRIIDLRRKQFNLDKVYAENDKIKIATCLTTPEILIIINCEQFEEYYKVKTQNNPIEVYWH